jgi:nucleoside-diphosphate-sugar epimerase
LHISSTSESNAEPFFVQDPNRPYSAVIPIFITRMLKGGSPVVNGDGGQSRDFTYVANVVDANLAAMTCEGPYGESDNVATGKSISLLELIAAIDA